MELNLKRQLEISACKVRKGVLEGTHSASSGHPGGSLSITDILTYLYFKEMNINPEEPHMENRDRLVLSKGHSAPALYSVLANRGFFDVEELKTLRQSDSRLQGHPSMHMLPGIDMSTGSLGQGISVAVGMALGAKIAKKDYRIHTILGDGEIQEGQVWEASMFAAAKKLDNLVAVLDNNNLQIDGTIEEVNSPYPLPEKFEAFGWHVIQIDGHDFEQIDKAFSEAKTVKNKPTIIICKTVKGKGISFMENKGVWHGKAPNDDEYNTGISELNKKLSELEA